MTTQTIEVILPDKLRAEISRLVESGWFVDEGEVIRMALRQFLTQPHVQSSAEVSEEEHHNGWNRLMRLFDEHQFDGEPNLTEQFEHQEELSRPAFTADHHFEQAGFIQLIKN